MTAIVVVISKPDFLTWEYMGKVYKEENQAS